MCNLFQQMEDVFLNLRYLPFHWGRVAVAYKSWWYRMVTLTDSDLEDKVPKNNLGVHSILCDKSHWTMGDGTMNFWNAVNEGYLDMTWEFFN